MQTAGARALREDDYLDSQPKERFARSEASSEPVPLRPSRRFERVAKPQAERRTIVITGQPTPPRRRRSAAQEQLVARPDRVALWAFLLGLFLVLVAAATANAAVL
jgi:hypothetical protein